MSAEPFAELRVLVLRGDLGAVAEHLAPLDEKERRRLSKPAWELHRALERGDEVEPPENASVWRRGRERVIGSPWEVRSAAQLAVLGVCSLGRARSLRSRPLGREERESLIRVLRDRRPPWLGDWVEHVLELDFGAPIGWEAIRGMVRDGLCPRPESAGYVRRMAHQMVFASPMRALEKPLEERLLEDPGLLEVEVWRLFEVDTGPEVWYPKVYREGEPFAVPGWAEALRHLAERGDLDRQRLLDVSLESLASGLAGRAASGHRRFHESLKPTLEEIAARQDGYRVLLGSRQGAVAGFALKALGRLHRGGRLDVVPFLAAAAAVFELPARAQPLRALGLVARCLEGSRDAEVRTPGLAAVAAALLHPAPDVQEKAVGVLEGMEGGLDALDAEVRGRLEQALSFVAQPLAGRLAEGLGLEAPAADDGPGPSEGELKARFAALPAEERERVGLPQWPGASLPEPWQAGFSRLAFLREADRVAPLGDFEELVDAVSHAVEIVDSATEIERLLGGLARCGAERPAEFARRTEALARRLDSRQGGFTATGLGGAWGGAPLVLVDLLRTWLSGRRVRSRGWFATPTTGPYPFLRQRVDEVADRLARGESGPLLAEPTHRRGWIDPRTLVDRVARRRGTLAGTREPADLVQALLRLAPDHRREARAKAEERLSGSDLELIDFALGGDRPPPPLRPRAAAVWLAAARARCPRGSVRPLLDDAARSPWARFALTFVGQGADALESARYDWRATTTTRRYFLGQSGSWPHVEVRVEGHRRREREPRNVAWEPLHRRLPRELKRAAVRALFATSELPTSALHRLADEAWEDVDQQTAWQVGWAAQVWPAETDPILAAGVRWISRRLDSTGAASSPHHAYLGSLLDGERPWTEIAYLAAGTALLARDAEVRGVAVDALIEGIEDGRVHPRPLGDCLAGLWEGGWAKANRLTSGLDLVVRVDPLHELVVAGALDRLVASWDAVPHGAHFVFQMLHDALAALEAPVSAGAARVLATVRGGGKTARLARALAARRDERLSRPYRRACLRAIEARVRRAERAREPEDST